MDLGKKSTILVQAEVDADLVAEVDHARRLLNKDGRTPKITRKMAVELGLKEFVKNARKVE